MGDRAYFAGQRLTYVDFLVYELVEIHLIMAPEALDGLDNLKAFQERVASLDKVAAYIKSDRFIGYPLTGPTSFFGGKWTPRNEREKYKICGEQRKWKNKGKT